MERGISEVSRVRVRGPLAEFAPLVAAQTREHGHTPLTTAGVLRLMAHLSRWMEARGLGPRDLCRDAARDFTEARRAAGHRRGRSLRSLDVVLAALDGAGPLPADPPAGPPAPSDRAGYTFTPCSNSITGPPPRVDSRPAPLARTALRAGPPPALSEHLAGRAAPPRAACGDSVGILVWTSAACIIEVVSLPAFWQEEGWQLYPDGSR